MSDNPSITYPFSRIEKLIREDVRNSLGHQGQINVTMIWQRKSKTADAIIELVAPSAATTEIPAAAAPAAIDPAPTFEDLPAHEQEEALEEIEVDMVEEEQLEDIPEDTEENILEDIVDEFDNDDPIKVVTEETPEESPVEAEETELDNTDSLFGDD